MARRFHYGPLLSVLALAGLGVALWHYYPRGAVPESPTTATPDTAPTSAPVPAAPPPVQFPIDQVQVAPEDATPLPRTATPPSSTRCRPRSADRSANGSSPSS